MGLAMSQSHEAATHCLCLRHTVTYMCCIKPTSICHLSSLTELLSSCK